MPKRSTETAVVQNPLIRLAVLVEDLDSEVESV